MSAVAVACFQGSLQALGHTHLWLLWTFLRICSANAMTTSNKKKPLWTRELSFVFILNFPCSTWKSVVQHPTLTNRHIDNLGITKLFVIGLYWFLHFHKYLCSVVCFYWFLNFPMVLPSSTCILTVIKTNTTYCFIISTMFRCILGIFWFSQ